MNLRLQLHIPSVPDRGGELDKRCHKTTWTGEGLDFVNKGNKVRRKRGRRAPFTATWVNRLGEDVDWQRQ